MTMTPYYRTTTLPWHVAEEEETRFHRILKRTTFIFLALALVLTVLPSPKLDRAVVEELPPRLAKLLLERQQSPQPAQSAVASPEPGKAQPEQPKQKEAKKEPQKVQQAAREKAQRSGLLAFKDELSDLRSDPALASLKNTQALSKGGAAPTVNMAERSLLAANATGGSGGINTARLSRDTGGQGLAGRTTTRVSSPTTEGGGGGGAAGKFQRGGGNKATRSSEEIQLVFDRNKSAIYSLYNRELRRDPALQGKVVIELKIAPSGRVLACRVISSELGSPELEEKFVARVMLFDFGAKDVDTTVVTNRFDFSPSS